MDFGKVDPITLEKVDFSFPPDDPRTWIALREGHANALRVGVGAPVWGVKSWLGTVYPAGLPARDFLKSYAEQFNSIELNTTHYGIPDAGTVERWRESTPDGFKFNVKFLQEISHRLPLGHDDGLLRAFCDSIMALGDRLGVSFLQLPPTFSVNEAPQLLNFFAKLPRGLEVAVEVRHPSFFQDHHLVARYYDTLRKCGAHAVITDVAGRRDVLHTSLPSSRLLIRFIGNSPQELGSLHPTDLARIEEWVHRLNTWIKLGLKQVEFFVHQPDDIQAPILISHFIARMNEICGLSLKPWTPQAPPTPNQMSFF